MKRHGKEPEVEVVQDRVNDLDWTSEPKARICERRERGSGSLAEPGEDEVERLIRHLGRQQ